jgi:uncharacterized protein
MTGQPISKSKATLPQTIALFPLSGALLLPEGQLPLNIFEPRYLKMIDDVLGGARSIGMIQPRDLPKKTDMAPALYKVGCAGRITSFRESGDGRYLVTLTGVRRFQLIEEIDVEAPYRTARIDWDAFNIDAHKDTSGEDIDREVFVEIMSDYLDTEGLKTDWDAVEEAPIESLVASLAMGCPFAPNEKQALLEAITVADRAKILMALMEMSGAADEPGEFGPLQ